MIIDTLVVIICLMADTPRIQRIEHVPINRFTEQLQQVDSLINVASSEAMKSAFRKTRLEWYRALGIISNEDYMFLKKGEKELEDLNLFKTE